MSTPDLDAIENRTDIDCFSESERETLYKIMRARRDMRHFLPGSKIDTMVLTRIMQAAHQAPSVGLMQPWRFIRIQKPALREKIALMVTEEVQQTAAAMGDRKTEFLKLKLDGVRECAELIAVVQAPDDGTLLGRRTMATEMALCSSACAIQNLWLAARAENLGMGWVSLFEPDALAKLLGCPEDARPIALLCLGPVQSFYLHPMLVATGWREEKSLDNMVFQNNWPDRQN